MNNNQNIDLLFNKAKSFLAFYAQKRRVCFFNVLTQEIIGDDEERGVEVIQHSKNIRAFIFKTHHQWGGQNQDHFWAKNDDDLFRQMFDYLDKRGEVSYTQPPPEINF